MNVQKSPADTFASDVAHHFSQKRQTTSTVNSQKGKSDNCSTSKSINCNDEEQNKNGTSYVDKLESSVTAQWDYWNFLLFVWSDDFIWSRKDSVLKTNCRSKPHQPHQQPDGHHDENDSQYFWYAPITCPDFVAKNTFASSWWRGGGFYMEYFFK